MFGPGTSTSLLEINVHVMNSDADLQLTIHKHCEFDLEDSNLVFFLHTALSADCALAHEVWL